MSDLDSQHFLDPFVSPTWLGEHRSEVVLADARYYLDGRDSYAAYRAGHLPGAVFIDVEHWLSGPPSAEDGRHPLPAPEVFAEGMAAAGIGDDTVVVAYDDAGGVIAARLVWMLRSTGHRAALLDGGLDAWGGPLEHTSTLPDRARFSPVPWPTQRLATAEDALDPETVTVDARPRERYDGHHPDPVDPRAGRIPGARSLPCRHHLGADKTLLPAARLREALHAAGVADARAMVSYCGSGITACHNLLVAEHLGLGLGRLYVGSWSQYSQDPTRPVETTP
jgi:thiosulfate/3-mercaptopyruvate sulfurtransferase